MRKSVLAAVACIGVAALAGDAPADPGRCSGRDVVYSFKYDGSDTTGCIGIDRPELEAGRGSALYVDTYCGEMREIVPFTLADDEITLKPFRYGTCVQPAANLWAHVSLQGVSGSCFDRLRFDWVGTRTESYPASPTPAARMSCVPAQ